MTIDKTVVAVRDASDTLWRFVGRRDAFALQVADGSYRTVDRGITPQDLRRHLAGDCTLGTYTLVPGADGGTLAGYGCLDLDRMDVGALRELWRAAASILPVGCLVPESSGRKGFHLWVVLREPIPAWKVRAVLLAVAERARVGAVEVFPKQNELSPHQPYGNLVKLPLGLHRGSGKRSCFLDPAGLVDGCVDPASPEDLDVDPLDEADLDRALAAVGAKAPGPPADQATPPRCDSSDFPPADPRPIVAGCAWIRHCRDDAAELAEPEWYAMLGIIGRCREGERLAHEWSSPYPRYSPEETAAKLRHALRAAGPRTCEHIRAHLGGERYCATCLAWDLAKSPISFGLVGQPRKPPRRSRSAHRPRTPGRTRPRTAHRHYNEEDQRWRS